MPTAKKYTSKNKHTKKRSGGLSTVKRLVECNPEIHIWVSSQCEPGAGLLKRLTTYTINTTFLLYRFALFDSSNFHSEVKTRKQCPFTWSNTFMVVRLAQKRLIFWWILLSFSNSATVFHSQWRYELECNNVVLLAYHNSIFNAKNIHGTNVMKTTKKLLKFAPKDKQKKKTLTNSCTWHSTVRSLLVVLLQKCAVEWKKM